MYTLRFVVFDFVPHEMRENGEIISTKPSEYREHGVGIKNIIKIVEKYDGSYVIKHDEEEFIFSIMI